VAIVGRTALMLGDHHGSGRKTPFPGNGKAKQLSARYAFANTTSSPVPPLPKNEETRAALRLASGRSSAAPCAKDGRVFADT
jgi:hypothetical protein